MKLRAWVAVFVLAVFLTAGGRAVADAPDITSIPKVDVHAHMYAPMPELAEMLERLNFQVINICTGGTDPDRMSEERGWVEAQHKAWPDRFAVCATFDLTQRDAPDYGEQVAAYLDGAFASGAVMVKIYKEVGMEIKDADGNFVMPDNPVFDPVYQYLARKKVPLLAHLAEPRAAWLPLDPESVHFNYYSRHPEWHFYKRTDVTSWESIIDARSRLLEKHPDLTMVGAHLGSMAYNVDVLGEYLDRYPNFYVDIAARTGDLSRQPPEKVREFFIRYQDRVLYGSDIGIAMPEDETYTRDEVAEKVSSAEKHYRTTWQYYAGTGRVTILKKEVESLNLPMDVVEKFYYANARRLIPGLKLAEEPF